MDLTIAAAGLSLSLLASLWKAFSVIGTLEKQLLKLDHQIDRVELVVNGVRERMEHINTRISSIQREQQATLDDLEAYLHKNTSYERRGHS